jgi:sensor histidine kinase YesM
LDAIYFIWAFPQYLAAKTLRSSTGEGQMLLSLYINTFIMPIIERIVQFNTSHRILSHVLFWIVVSILLLNRYDLVEYKTPENILYRHIYYMSFLILSSYFVAYLVIPGIMAAKTYLPILIYFLAGSYVICVLSRAVVVYWLEPLTREPPFGQESIIEIMSDFQKLFLHYFAQTFSAAWIFAMIRLIRDQYIAQQRSLALEKEKVQSALNVLKAQLNPHFLFNTLNNIYSLSLLNSPLTSKAIAGLSEMLDHVLYKCNEKYVPISEEIKLIDHYIDLEKLRYDERLQVHFTHQTDEDASIVPLVLLSLVENAFKHGAGEDIGKPVIDIDLTLKNRNFHFSISNSFLPEPVGHKIDRIGLMNIRKQLDLLYADKHQLQVTSNNNIFIVILDIDLNGN